MILVSARRTSWSSFVPSPSRSDGLWTEVPWWKDGPDLTTLDAGLVKGPITDASTRSDAVEPVTLSASESDKASLANELEGVASLAGAVGVHNPCEAESFQPAGALDAAQVDHWPTELPQQAGHSMLRLVAVPAMNMSALRRSASG
jgi:hypothetical protein